MVDWDELMCLEGPAVWRTVYRLVRNQADAEECFQETFLAAFEVSNRQPVRNWPALLQRLATSRAIDRIRSQMRRRRREEFVDLTRTANCEVEPSQHAEATELAAALRWAIAQLPARQAEVFCLHELAEWTSPQIAEHLGMTSNAVGVVLHRARQKLQQLLKIERQMSTMLNRQGPQ